jgi:hypothetical protein
MPKRVMIDPAQCAALGIDPEDTAIALPEGWEQLDEAGRRAWAREELERAALDIFRDLAGASGGRVTRAQEAEYLRRVRSGIERMAAADCVSEGDHREELAPRGELELGDLELRREVFRLACAGGYPEIVVGPYARTDGLFGGTISGYRVPGGEDQWRKYCRCVDVDWLSAAREALLARG